MLRSAFLLLLLLLSHSLSAQVINNSPSYKTVNSDSYFRFCYDNDFFAAIDEYYTQGIDAELVLPQLAANPLNNILIQPHFAGRKYGIGLQHNGYTPSSISSDDILYGDRPFAGAILLKSFVISTDTVYKQKFTSVLYIGMIGPVAGTRQMQESIHRALANITPHGWQYQVSNDIAVNYHVDYEKQLLALGRFLSFSPTASLDLGTINCKGAIGANLMAGYFTSPYSTGNTHRRSASIYVYERPEISFIGCDATLQGGIFNHSSPYIIKETDLTRITFGNRVGVVLAWQGIYLEYFAALLTKEFVTGKQHGYGGVQIAFTL